MKTRCVLVQNLLDDADEREQALRVEIAELKAIVMSSRVRTHSARICVDDKCSIAPIIRCCDWQREAESVRNQCEATAKSLQDSSSRVHRDLLTQLRESEKQVRMAWGTMSLLHWECVC